jgi:serine/threonine protein kinase
MINALLTRDYTKRITAEEAMNHKWVRQQITAEVRLIAVGVGD